LKINEVIWYSEAVFEKRRKRAMSSNTKKTDMRRKRKKGTQGKKRKGIMSKASTPTFAVHVEKAE
jgi:hypothetical protein